MRETETVRDTVPESEATKNAAKAEFAKNAAPSTKTAEDAMSEGKSEKVSVLRRLSQYVPWFLLLLGMGAFSCLLLWLADTKAFRACMAAILLASLLLFAAVCAVLLFMEQSRERAFRAFLEEPDEYHEAMLQKAAGAAGESAIRLLGNTLREKEAACSNLQTQLAEYEEYVEAWAHETKMPLSLLTVLLDNRREELSEGVCFKLDYIENRLGEYIEQMLFYARVKGNRKDYLFRHIAVTTCIEEVLEDYRPLLEEKRFHILLPERDGSVYTDRRGFRFLLQQIVSNAVKYASVEHTSMEPELCFAFITGEYRSTLRIRDNGTGVRSCDLPYIFEKGFTGQAKEGRRDATGMGLYLAKEVAKDLGLVLEASSEWGKGFEIAILFPVVDEV